MAGTSLITRYLNAPLPTISEQKRLPFRPEPREIEALYRSINKHVFNNELTQPEIYMHSIKKCWGLCNWEDTRQKRGSHGKQGTWCYLEISDKWFSPQWCVNVLAHEMVHQYQWDIYRWQHREEFGREINLNSAAHGPSFFAWRGYMSDYGLDLKTSHGMKRWFKHQDLRKC